MKVFHLSVECFPVAKVGGLADVVGALPRYQRQLGVDSSVVMPWYDLPFTKDHKWELVGTGSISQGSELITYNVYKESVDSLGFPLYTLKIEGKLDRNEVYGYADEGEQWIAFQHAFLDWLCSSDIQLDIIHCHDHHTGLIPFLIQYGNDFKKISKVKTVFTVHNGQYQGKMNWNKGILLPAFDTWKWGLLDWDGMINSLAAAVKCTNVFTTVSEGYLQELFIEANGLESLFRHEAAKGYGIVNGIDATYWNPALDTLIPNKYRIDDAQQGKLLNKEAFCQRVGLPAELPLVSYIGRFALEKGADLLPVVIEKLFATSSKVAVYVLGSGDSDLQSRLAELAIKHADRLAVYFGYNEALAHEVYAASDMLLMPSRVEPCGLNQLYALKYGTIPIVRAIGGLRDTVKDISQDEGYGFVFNNINTQEIVNTIGRALDQFDSSDWQLITQRAMQLDFSWDKSAKKYIDLYYQLLK